MDTSYFNKQIVPEIFWRTSRSGGKGGQHVNKTESRVELLFDFLKSTAFSQEEKERLQKQLSSSFADGIIRVVTQTSRSQHKNKEEALRKLFDILSKGLFIKKKRKPSKPSVSALQKKRKSKEHRSAVKKQRSRKNWQDD